MPTSLEGCCSEMSADARRNVCRRISEAMIVCIVINRAPSQEMGPGFYLVVRGSGPEFSLLLCVSGHVEVAGGSALGLRVTAETLTDMLVGAGRRDVGARSGIGKTATMITTVPARVAASTGVAGVSVPCHDVSFLQGVS